MRYNKTNPDPGRTSRKRVTLITLIAVLTLSMGAISGQAQTMSGGKYSVTSSVQASGGGTSTGSGNKVIEGTAGQSGAGGPFSASHFGHDSGFWPATVAVAGATPTSTPTPTPTPTPSATPSVSINDVALSEGNSGITNYVFTVTLSSAGKQVVTVDYATTSGTATLGNDYQPANGTVIFAVGEVSKTVTVMISGDTEVEVDETFFINLSNVTNATIAKAQGTGTIINDDSAVQSTIQFAASTYSAPEALGAITVTVTRAGDATGPASVDYATADDTAVQKSDFEIAAGRITFAAGETSKTITVLINEDIYVEGNENFRLVLSNPLGGSLGAQATTQIALADDVSEPLANTIDDPESFVYMHYHDFLNREPDPAGLQFWTNQITSCGSDAKCIEERRINVSASFFLSIEFQETGYLRYLLEKESFNSTPKYTEFMRDVQEISRDIIVGSTGWAQKLKDNQQQFAEQWVNRPEFKAVYDGMSNEAFVNAIYANAGISASQSERGSLIAALDTQMGTRAQVLLEVAADVSFRQKEHNAAFVLMQYFGYLRRDPTAAPDSDLSGYNFWLNKLNQFGGNYINAEMIKAFITSFEYRKRFGP